MIRKIRLSGFSLIELSIVLVIIGLVIGGIMVGKDMISAAVIRSQIAQIEKYNTAVNTFRIKYGYLPGDIPEPAASSSGFIARGSAASEGDGNGILEGLAQAGAPVGVGGCAGENPVVWRDLSSANLIEGAFNTASIDTPTTYVNEALALILPKAVRGNTNYVHTLSWNNTNYFALSAARHLGGTYCTLTSIPNIPVIEAYNIDTKLDDGLPYKGRVQAMMVIGISFGGANWTYAGPSADNFWPQAGSSATCADNDFVIGPVHYSTAQNGGAGLNCALIFRFQ